METLIRASPEEIWGATQSPDDHNGWDLRFSDICYLPRPDESAPQRFRYTTRLGFGLRIEGVGESTGTRADATGCRTSALRFWSEDPKSLIRDGSGYWKYVPTSEGVRFFTWYDYTTRFGSVGRTFDRWIFRPLLGWATAWSFDRLRLWVERGIDPERSARAASIATISRITLAFVWIYQGLVPKLVFRNADELTMLRSAGISGASAPAILSLIGAAEIALGTALLLVHRPRPLFVLTVLVMVLATIVVAAAAPAYLVAAFNPVSLNVAVAGLAVVGYVSIVESPSAFRCLRVKPR